MSSLPCWPTNSGIRWRRFEMATELANWASGRSLLQSCAQVKQASSEHHSARFSSLLPTNTRVVATAFLISFKLFRFLPNMMAMLCFSLTDGVLTVRVAGNPSEPERQALFATIRNEIWLWARPDLKLDPRPAMPRGLRVGRPRDKWRPLIAIADSFGPEWGRRARAAALEFVRNRSNTEISLQLLEDTRELFTSLNVDRFLSKVLIKRLRELADNYDYDALTNLISTSRSNSSTFQVSTGGAGAVARASSLEPALRERESCNRRHAQERSGAGDRS